MSKMMGGIIGIIMGVVLFASALLPILSATTEDLKVTNTVGYNAVIADSSDDVDVVMEWSANVLTIDGITYTYGVNDIAMFSDVAYFTTTTVSPYCTFVYGGVSIANPDTIQVTIEDGQIVAEWEVGGTPGAVTLDYNTIVYRYNSGEDRIFNLITAEQTVYYTDSLPIYGVRGVGSYPLLMVGEKAVYQGTDYVATVSGSEYKGDILRAIISYTATSEMSADVGGTVYYPFYGAVSGELISSKDGTINALLWIIPILIGAGLVVATVGLVRGRE